MDLQVMLKDAMKSKNDLARDLLRVIMGEASTLRARTGREPGDVEVQGIIRKLIAGNAETRKELEQRGQTQHAAYERLARESIFASLTHWSLLLCSGGRHLGLAFEFQLPGGEFA